MLNNVPLVFQIAPARGKKETTFIRLRRGGEVNMDRSSGLQLDKMGRKINKNRDAIRDSRGTEAENMEHAK